MERRMGTSHVGNDPGAAEGNDDFSLAGRQVSPVSEEYGVRRHYG
jgi:hypothetical protein